MSKLSVFNFNQAPVRVVMKEGEPWLVAKDLCEVLGISKYRDALSRLDDDEKSVASFPTPGGVQKLSVVSESGMYALVLTSRKPEAKAFRKWITSNVLPEIRRTGSYSAEKSLPSNVYFQRLRHHRDHQIEDDKWCVFKEGSDVLLHIEQDLGLEVDQFDLCDGSIGYHWSKYRKGKEWANETGKYLHIFRDRRGKQKANAYLLSELPYFRKWLKEIYIVEHLPSYLKNKYGEVKQLPPCSPTDNFLI
jgi:prophage antirepressor-like protein